MLEKVVRRTFSGAGAKLVGLVGLMFFSIIADEPPECTVKRTSFENGVPH